MLASVMVESNYGEERLARIEDMLQGLQRESAARATAIARTVLSHKATIDMARQPFSPRYESPAKRHASVSVASVAYRRS